jgi:hypothetical protein
VEWLESLEPEHLYPKTDKRLSLEGWSDWLDSDYTIEFLKALRREENRLLRLQVGGDSIINCAKAAGLDWAVRQVVSSLRNEGGPLIRLTTADSGGAKEE